MLFSGNADRRSRSRSEVERARQMPDAAGSCLTFRAVRCLMWPSTLGKALSPLAKLHSQPDKVLRQTLLASTIADQSGWVWLCLTPNDRRPT